MAGAEAGAIITVGAIAIDGYEASKGPPQWAASFIRAVAAVLVECLCKAGLSRAPLRVLRRRPAILAKRMVFFVRSFLGGEALPRRLLAPDVANKP